MNCAKFRLHFEIKQAILLSVTILHHHFLKQYI